MDTTYGTIFKIYAILGPAAYFSPAPFGRFHKQSKYNLDGRLAWVLQESVGPIVFLYHMSQYGWTTFSRAQMIACSMFAGHYLFRAFLWPLFLMHSISPSHPVVAMSAATWQYLNGTVQAIAIQRMGTPSALISLIGLSLFVIGLTTNILHDKILADLRQTRPGYSIPYGYLYEYISFPHYLCEWVEWLGYAIYLGQPEGWWFLLLEILVMLPRAASGHQWYKDKFGRKFPADRKIILPYIL